MFGAVVAKIGRFVTAEEDARIAREPCFGDFAYGRPARRPIGRDMARLPCAPEPSLDRTRASKEAAPPGDRCRKRAVWGKRVSGGVGLGGRCTSKPKVYRSTHLLTL